MAKPIQHYLVEFLEAHLRVHGCDYHSEKYIRDNLALWRETYGDLVADEVRAKITPILKSKT